MLSIELNLNHPVQLSPDSSCRCGMSGMNTPPPQHTPITSLLAIRMPREESAVGSWTTPVSLSSTSSSVSSVLQPTPASPSLLPCLLGAQDLLPVSCSYSSVRSQCRKGYTVRFINPTVRCYQLLMQIRHL